MATRRSLCTSWKSAVYRTSCRQHRQYMQYRQNQVLSSVHQLEVCGVPHLLQAVQVFPAVQAVYAVCKDSTRWMAQRRTHLPSQVSSASTGVHS